MRTLDEILKAERIPSVRVLKIDVEGFEESVFKGMKESLRKKAIQYILCEISSDSARNAILKVMKDAGYAPQRVDAQGILTPATANYPRDIVFARSENGY